MILPINQIIVGDCLSVMQEWPDNCVDLVLTDPPYGLGFPYDSYVDSKENLVDLIEKTMPELLRISKLVAITCGITPMHFYPMPNWTLACVWDTTGSYGMFGYTQWFPVLLYGKDLGGIGKINNILKSDVIKITGGGGVGFMRDSADKDHPCPKPITLIKKLIQRLSMKGNLIVDTMNGSGTTCVAAKMLGRRYIGIDISEEYCQIARQRLEAVDTGVPVKEQRKGQMAMFKE